MTELATPEDVRRTLARQIVVGELRPGQRLGAERALAAELGVSRALLRQALSILEDGGMIRLAEIEIIGGSKNGCAHGFLGMEPEFNENRPRVARKTAARRASPWPKA